MMTSPHPVIRIGLTAFLDHIIGIDERNGNSFLTVVTVSLILTYVFCYLLLSIHYENIKDTAMLNINVTFFFIIVFLFMWGERLASIAAVNPQNRVVREREGNN